tara:strand:+ start:203 stop:565 length:363 start_codon:yes stop_codon:yes gene_type:complete
LLIYSHIFLAVAAVIIGSINLFSIKGTTKHKVIGWIWVITMLYVSFSSFWIKELNDGTFSWIHILTIWVIISLLFAIYFIKKKKILLHKIFMIGNMIGLTIAGIFTLYPGRFIPSVLGLF